MKRPPPRGPPLSPKSRQHVSEQNEGAQLRQKVFELENKIYSLVLEHKNQLLEAVEWNNKGQNLGVAVLQDLLAKDERVENLRSQIMSFLSFGTKVTQVGIKGETAPKCLFLCHEGDKLYVCLGNLTHDNKPLKTAVFEKIAVGEIERVVLGQYSDAFHRMHAYVNVTNPLQHPFFDFSFQILFGKKKKSLDVWTETPSDFEAWIVALRQVTGLTPEWGDTLDLTLYPHVHLLDPEEIAFCSTHHVLPVDYILAKERILGQDSHFLTLFDIRMVSCLDLNHSQRLFAFFVHRGWLRNRRVFYLDRGSIEKNVKFGVLDSAPMAGGALRDIGDDCEF